MSPPPPHVQPRFPVHYAPIRLLCPVASVTKPPCPGLRPCWRPPSSPPRLCHHRHGSPQRRLLPDGGAICRLLNEESARHGLHCTVQSTSGSIANLAALAKGRYSSPWMQSDVLYHAVHGSGLRGPGPGRSAAQPLAAPQGVPDPDCQRHQQHHHPGRHQGQAGRCRRPNSGDRVTSRALLDAMGWRIADFSRPPVISPGNRLGAL